MTKFSVDMMVETLQSQVSQDQYKTHVRRFLEFTKLPDYDDILKVEILELQNLVKAYAIHLKGKISPNSFGGYLNPIKSFLEANDIDLNWRRIKKVYPRKVKKTGQVAYTTEDIQLMLKFEKIPRNQAIIHFFGSTAVRVSTLDNLKMKDLRDMPHGCKTFKAYNDDIEEYTSFLTPEAAYALEVYFSQRRKKGEILTADSLVFCQKNGKPVNKYVTSTVISRALVRAGLRVPNDTSKDPKSQFKRHEKMTTHAFRKRYNTILKLNNEVNDNAIEKLLGHTNGLDGVYLKITDERLFEEFQKGIDGLLVTDEFRDKLRISKLEEENSKVNEDMIESLQSQINELKGLTNPKDYSQDFKDTMKELENTNQLEEIPLAEQIKSLTPKQKDLLLVQLVNERS